ncbi:MAG: hypothetical protein AAFP68_12140 [Pseudomonadota bacterium]
MKAFVAAIAVMVLISIAASFGLQNAGFSAAEMFSKDDVRLGD